MYSTGAVLEGITIAMAGPPGVVAQSRSPVTFQHISGEINLAVCPGLGASPGHHILDGNHGRHWGASIFERMGSDKFVTNLNDVPSSPSALVIMVFILDDISPSEAGRYLARFRSVSTDHHAAHIHFQFGPLYHHSRPNFTFQITELTHCSVTNHAGYSIALQYMFTDPYGTLKYSIGAMSPKRPGSVGNTYKMYQAGFGLDKTMRK
jgi:hypothetical protein